MKKLLFLSFILAFFLAIPVKASVDINFDPNLIISDEDMLAYNSLSLSQIQNFLEQKNSYLATYQTINAYGSLKTAAEIIYEAAALNYDCKDANLSEEPTEIERQAKCKRITTISPKFLIVLIQKESSLIEDTSPSQQRLDFATGYGCFDGLACNPRWQGFGKQVNSAALQFLAYLQYPSRYPFRAGQLYTFNNNRGTISTEPLLVSPANQATAALYNYTPHVFNGNYNVWRLYNRYFPQSNTMLVGKYPNGSLLQVAGEAGVWLIENNQKRPFLSWGALTSRYNVNRIITVSASDLNPYPKGTPLKFPNYSILKSPSGDIYLITDDAKRKFANLEIFKSFGFHPDEIINASYTDLSYYHNGKEINENSSHLTGALLQDPVSGGIYYVLDDKKAPIIDKVMLNTKFKNYKIQKSTTAELEKYEKIEAILFEDGEILKSKTVSTVYLISDGKKSAFVNGDIFLNLGYNFSNIIEVSPQLLSLYPFGEMIRE
jgi:hypothetical protein